HQDLIEITRPYFTLVANRRITKLLAGELLFLQTDISCYAFSRKGVSKFEGPHIGGMPSRQRDELILIAQSAEFLIKCGDCLVVEVLLPVKGWRTVVRQEFAWELPVDGPGEFFGLGQVRPRCLEPENIRVGSIGQSSRYGRRDAVLHLVVALSGS